MHRPLVGGGLSGPTKSGPVVSVVLPEISLVQMRFAPTDLEKKRHFHGLFFDSRKHDKGPGDLQGFARGDRMRAEWIPEPASLRRNLPCLYTAGSPMHIELFFEPKGFTADTTVNFEIVPVFDKNKKQLLPTTFSVVVKPGDPFVRKVVTLEGALSVGEVGRFRLELEIRCLSTVRFHNPRSQIETEHTVYLAVGTPLDPAKAEEKTTVAQGSLSGTPRRLAKLAGALGKSRRHDVSSEKALIELYWKVHAAINDRTPPYFHGGNAEVVTTGAFTEIDNLERKDWPWKDILDVADQWLMWVKTGAESRTVEIAGKKVKQTRHWNDASCIGHAQLQKTMMALLGLGGHLAWVYPHTTFLPVKGHGPEDDPDKRTPPGDIVTFKDDELFSLDEFNHDKQQFWVFPIKVTPPGGTPETHEVPATVVLLHGDLEPPSFENFEGCFRSPQGRFLTGGFSTSRNPPSFRKNRGFKTATELLTWWTSLKEDGGKPRVLCWFSKPEVAGGKPLFFDIKGDVHEDPRTIVKHGLGLIWTP